MSMTGNKHYAEAVAAELYYSHRNVDTDADTIALGQLEATLALAHEQRTANLIAYQANVESSYFNKLTTSRSSQANDLNRQILERLGLA